MTEEKDWVDMIPTVAFSHRTSMSASTNVAPLELILGSKPHIPIDIHMKYPTDQDLDHDMTEEEVKNVADYCLSFNVEQMKKVKAAAIVKGPFGSFPFMVVKIVKERYSANFYLKL